MKSFKLTQQVNKFWAEILSWIFYPEAIHNLSDIASLAPKDQQDPQLA